MKQPTQYRIKLNQATTIVVQAADVTYTKDYVIIPSNKVGRWTDNNDIYIKRSFGYLHFTPMQIYRLLGGKPLQYRTRKYGTVNLYFDALGQYKNHTHDSRGKLFLDIDGTYEQQLSNSPIEYDPDYDPIIIGGELPADFYDSFLF